MADKMSEEDMVNVLEARGYDVKHKHLAKSLISAPLVETVYNCSDDDYYYLDQEMKKDVEKRDRRDKSYYIPNIPPFSGDDPPQHGDVSYNNWRLEVQSLSADADVNSNVLVQSLRGTAREKSVEPVRSKGRDKGYSG